MRIIIVIAFVIACAYVGLNIVEGFTDTVKNHNQRIERAAGYWVVFVGSSVHNGVCCVCSIHLSEKEIIMIKKIVIAFVIIATAIVVAEWTLSQLEEGYTPSYPTKLDK